METKRILSIVLAFAMIVSTMVFPVFAESVTDEETLIAALANSADVVLDNDITISTSIVTSGITSTIDLDGHTLNVRAGDNKFTDETKLIIKNGTINIDDVVVTGNAIFCLDEYEETLVTEVTLENVNVEGKDYSSAYGVFYIGDSSILNVNGGSWTLSNDLFEAGGVFKADDSRATLSISGTTMDLHNVRRVVTYAATEIEDSTLAIYGDADGVDAEMEHGFNRSPLVIKNSTITMKDMVGRGITAEGGAVSISDNSTVTITNVQEATIDVRNGQTVTVDNTSNVAVDKEPTIADGCTIDGNVTDTSKIKSAYIGKQGYDSLADAVDAAVSGDTIVLSEGEHTMVSLSKNLTFKGAEDADKSKVIVNLGTTSHSGSGYSVTVAFEKLTLNREGVTHYKGFHHATSESYTNCIINGEYWTYATTANFTNCVFNQTSSDAYNLWTYGSSIVNISNCTFNSAGKSVLVYNEGTVKKTDLTVSDTAFNASKVVSGKAAIEIDTSLMADGANITANNVKAEGFGNGNVSGNSLWNNKKGNEGANNDITIVVDGKTVLEPNYAAKIGTTLYDTLQAAIDAAQAGDTVKVKAGTHSVPTMKTGITIEGEGEVLLEGTISGTLENLTLKNLHIKGGNAQRWAYAKGNLLFEDVTFEATSVYALHFDGITAGANILYKNCTIIGWAAMSGSPESFVFDGCTIKDNGTYGLLRTYFDAEIKNCTFDVDGANTEDIYQEGVHAVDSTVKVNNCVNANGDIKDILNISKDAYIYVDDVLVLAPPVKVATKAELDAAIAAAKGGDTIVLTDNIDYGSTQLKIEKAITLDLGGKTLTTSNNWGGTSLKNGPSIKNGTISHIGRTAAIKVWDVETFEDLTITVAANEPGKVIGGIVIQENAAGIDTIKNVTINGDGLTNGIETYNCGNATEDVIGSMENVTIDAVGTGMLISAPCGTATNCDIKGGTTGIEIWIKGTYSASLDLKGTTVTGGVYAHDEFKEGVVNNGTLSLTVDDTTNVTAEDITLTLNQAEKVEGVLAEVKNTAVAKVNGTYYATLNKAVAAANAGETITIMNDATNTELLNIDKNITIDFDGKTLSLGQVASTFALRAATTTGGIQIAEDVTFKNGTIDLTGATTENAGIFDISGANARLTLKDINLVGKDVAAKHIIHTYYGNGDTKLTLDNVDVDITNHIFADSKYFAMCTLNSGNEEKYPTAVVKDSDIKINGGNGLFNSLNVDIDNSTFDLDGMQNHIFRQVMGEVADTVVKAEIARDGESFIKNTKDITLTFSGKTILDNESDAPVTTNGKIVTAGFRFNFDINGYTIPEGYKATTQKKHGETYWYVVPDFTVAAVADVEADTTTNVKNVKTGDKFTVNVVVTGGDFTNARWELVYDTSKVKLTNGSDTTGILSGFVKDGKEGAADNGYDEFKNGDIIASYEFEVLDFDKEALDVDAVANFTITKATVHNYAMAVEFDAVEATKKEDSVTIGLKTESDKYTLRDKTVEYDGMEHRGDEVENVPAETFVTYGKDLAELKNGFGTDRAPAEKKVGVYSYNARVDVKGSETYYVENVKLTITQKPVVPTVDWSVDPNANKVGFKPVIEGVVDGTFTGIVTVTVVDGDTDETNDKKYTFEASEFEYSNGQAIYKGAETVITDAVGKLTLKVTYTSGTSDNYKTSENTVDTDVDKISATDDIVKALDEAIKHEFVYDGNAHSVEITVPTEYKNWKVDETVSELGKTVTNVGVNQFVKVVFNDESGKYNPVTVYVTLKVTPRPVTIRVNNDVKKELGTADNFADEYVIEPINGLVNSGDLGTITVIRKETGETAKSYGLTADYTPNKNYHVTVIDGTLTIGAPDFKIEVVDNTLNGNQRIYADVMPEYTVGSPANGNVATRLILVHTDGDYAFFSYNGDKMYDVSDAGYKYFEHNYTDNQHNERRQYKYVYAIVVEAEHGYEATEANEQLYAAKVKFEGSDEKAPYAPVKVTYDADINGAEDLHENDYSTTRGVYNGIYDNDLYQISILKADYETDKIVNTADAQKIKDEVIK